MRKVISHEANSCCNTVVAIQFFLSYFHEILVRMSGHSRKCSTLNRQNTGHDGAPPKYNAAQHRNPEESPQGTTREVVLLTQEDISRIIEGVVISFADINS